MYILAQTFYIDPNAAANSTSVFVTGVDIYLKSKPHTTKNRSGISNPGLHISICDTNLDGSPNFTSIYPESHLDVLYSTSTADTGAATATSLTFNQPIPLASGKKYALRIQAYDPDYNLWTGTAGNPIVGTNTKLGGFSAGFQGALFDYASDGTVTARAASQLKHAIYTAKFTANTATYEYVNEDMEFLTLTGQSSAFIGGDIIFTKYANVSAQTVLVNSTTVTGTGTTFLSTFTNGSYISVWGSAANGLTVPIVRQVLSVTNATSLTVAEPYASAWRLSTIASPYFKTQVGVVYYTNQYANTIYLKGSTANSTLRFQAGQVIAGSISSGDMDGGIAIKGVITATIVSVDNLSVSQVHPEVAVRLPTGGSAKIKHSLARYDGSNYSLSNSNFINIDNLKTTSLTNYNGLIMSRSNEVVNSTNLYNGKSSVKKITIEQANTSNGVYTAPYVQDELVGLHVGQYLINNDATNEAHHSGNALSKHITTKLTFDSGKSSEGLFVYLTAFQPAGTSVLAYAKIHNTKDSDAFDDKEWTQLVTVNNTGGQVSTTAANNYVEIDFGLPSQPPSLNVTGVVTTTAASATVTGSATNFGTDILVNDVVKIYSSTAPNTNYFIATVASIANTTQLTLNSLVATNTAINGSGLYIDKITDPYQAFINPQNNNVVRYYGLDLTEYDTFDVAQFKIILLSNNVNIVPRVNNLQALGVSA